LKVLYQSEGVLGQITVYDYISADNHDMRILLINGVPQTFVIKKQIPISHWPYVHRLATLASTKPAGSKALLVGMAGGTIAMELDGMGFQTDIVEIDSRMPEIAEQYFGLDPKRMNIIIDDGRHFFNTTKNKYDIIIIDVVNGEVQPNHMFTKEAIENIKRICTKDGLVLLNYQGYIEGKKGLSIRPMGGGGGMPGMM